MKITGKVHCFFEQEEWREIRVFEAFAGYGSQLMALKQLEKDYPDKIKVTPVGIAEIDKYAIQAYKAVHGEVTNYGDISKINWDEVPDFDLFTYSFPCTDISIAGVQKGFKENSGTRSSLLWECRKAILAKKPKYLLLENVKALGQKKNIASFNKWLTELESYGYTNFTKVLNAKDYGVPQNRERVFVVSIREGRYEFPKGFKTNRCINDILETDCDKKYYIKNIKANKRLNQLLSSVKIEQTAILDAYNQSYFTEIAPTITTRVNADNNKAILQIGNLYPDTPNFKNRVAGRIYDPEGISPSIRANSGGNNMPIIAGKDYTIRKLTPRECFRLMGVTEENIDKIQAAGISNSQQYKMAGNSIVVDVLYHIFRKMFVDKESDNAELTLF